MNTEIMDRVSHNLLMHADEFLFHFLEHDSG